MTLHGTAAGPLGRDGWWLVGLLVLAAGFDVTRCGLAVAAQGRHAGPLLAVGLSAAAVTSWTALSCLRRRPWVGWLILAIGMASAAQAAASGFHAGYAVTDVGTAVVGLVLAISVLAGDRLIPNPGAATSPPQLQGKDSS